MEEFAFFELTSDRLPRSLAELQTALEGAGLRGEYKVMDDMLGVVSDRGRFLFSVEPAFNGPMPHPAGIDVAADVEDRTDTEIYLTKLFNIALPSHQ